MRLTIASGKGGTGKTTVATSLARAAADSGRRVAYLDCDVEEPNGAIFLRPAIWERRPVGLPAPRVDESLCTHCGDCGAICQYSAILSLGPKGGVLTFPGLCHGCGGCVLVCPSGAIAEAERITGRLEIGDARGVAFVQGILEIGEAMSPPVIRQVLRAAPPADLVIVDAPPGTSCPVVTSLQGSDLAILVTEPTPFGQHDLELAVAVVRELGLPFGVIVNRSDAGDDRTVRYCRREGIEILAEIPDDRRIAEAYSRGGLACEAAPEVGALFGRLLERLERTLPAVRPAEPEATATAAAPPTMPPVAPPPMPPITPAAAPAASPPGAPAVQPAGRDAPRPFELAVISGKGGTGKTSVVAALASLAAATGPLVVADCDVDAADLHLVLAPEVRRRQEFTGGKRAILDPDRCTACGECLPLCRHDAMTAREDGVVAIDPVACEGCGVCAWFCPARAIAMEPAVCGEWFVSATRHGPLVHARLGVAEENSGKLVSTVREAARAAAADLGRPSAGSAGAPPAEAAGPRDGPLILIDGSPGTGCPVIASVTGADLALVVTEPTLSGLHDLERVADLTRHLGVPAAVCVNKWDLNPDLTERIEREAARRGLLPLGRLRYDRAVTAAQIQGRAVVELPDAAMAAVAADLEALWRRLEAARDEAKAPAGVRRERSSGPPGGS